MRVRKIAASLVGVALLLGGTAACSSSSSTSGGGALTVGAPTGPVTNNNNPFVATAGARALGYGYLMYEPLAQANQIKPASTPAPWLASSWKWNADYTSVALTMRPGVTWSDGTALTAEDVAFTFGLFTKFPALNLDGLALKSATASGTTATLTFTSSQFVNQAKVLSTVIVPEHVWSSVKDPTTFANKQPVGSGPYVLKSWTQQSVVMTPNAKYWGGKPKVPEMRFVAYNDNTSLTTALTSGAVQWTGVFLPNYKKQYVDRDPAHNKIFFPSGLMAHTLYLNNAKAPFDDVALRRAVNLVIDRNQIVKLGESGLYPVISSPTGIAQPAGTSYIAGAYKDVEHAVDLGGAKKILTDAGYTYSGSKLIGKDGKQVSVTLTDPTPYTDYLTDLQIIAGQFKSLGIKATVAPTSAEAWAAAVLKGTFQATLRWTDNGATPYSPYQTIMDGAALKPVGTDAVANFGRVNIPQATAALRSYATTTDEAQRTAALATLQKIMVEQVPAIPIMAVPLGSEYITKSWTGFPSESSPYANPQPTGPNFSQVVMKLRPAQ